MENAFTLNIGIILLSLGFLHMYWGFFGIKHPEKVLPQPKDQEQVAVPGKTAIFLVGSVLLLFALLFIAKLFNLIVADWLVYAHIFIGLLFLARAVGDFRHIGFFKTFKDTPFAKMDNRYYSPLCLLVAILIAISLQ